MNRDKQWTIAAIDREIDAIRRCGAESAHNPNSEWWRSVIRIASVAKGSGRRYVVPENIRRILQRETPQWVRFKRGRVKGIDYLWGRAMNRAYPRYRLKDTPHIRVGEKKPGG